MLKLRCITDDSFGFTLNEIYETFVTEGNIKMGRVSIIGDKGKVHEYNRTEIYEFFERID